MKQLRTRGRLLSGVVMLILLGACGSAPTSPPAVPRAAAPGGGDWDCLQVDEAAWRCQPAPPPAANDPVSEGPVDGDAGATGLD